MPMAKMLRAVSSLCAVVLLGSVVTHNLAAGEPEQPPRGEILWDGYGVPHVYAATVPDVVRGFGCAQIQLHAELILRKFATARGRLAEYFGAGAHGENLASDIMVRTENIPSRARRWLQAGGEGQRALLESFVSGVNDCAERA